MMISHTQSATVAKHLAVPQLNADQRAKWHQLETLLNKPSNMSMADLAAAKTPLAAPTSYDGIMKQLAAYASLA